MSYNALLADQDADTHEAIAAGHPAAQRLPEPEHWHPSRLDAEMAAASVGVGVLSGLLAGGVMWWATGQHPYLAGIGRLIRRTSAA